MKYCSVIIIIRNNKDVFNFNVKLNEKVGINKYRKVIVG